MNPLRTNRPSPAWNEPDWTLQEAFDHAATLPPWKEPKPPISRPAQHVRAVPTGTPDEAGTLTGTPVQRSDQAWGQRGRQGQQGAGRITTWTAAELMGIEFPPPKWAVPGLIAEGLSLLAGAPKLGKSWLVLGWAIEIASGGKVLGKIEVDEGDVLYLALEDTGRRLQNRIRKLLDGAAPPKRLTLTTACPSLPSGGAALIRAWLDDHAEARLVIIDTFAKVRGAAPAGMAAYDADYAALGEAKKIADDHGVAVVVVHHTRKAAADDFLDAISGTNGIAGAADAALILKRSRGEADGALLVVGRDIDESEYALRFETDTGAWNALEGPAIDNLVSETRGVILRHVRANPGQGPKHIADGTGLAYELVKKTCVRMLEDQQLVNNGRGRYEAVPAVPAVPVAVQAPYEIGTAPGTPVPTEGEETVQ